jgi:hypothetical protein
MQSDSGRLIHKNSKKEKIKSESNYSKILNSFLILWDQSNRNAHNYPGKDFDLQGYIDQKISAGETNITI